MCEREATDPGLVSRVGKSQLVSCDTVYVRGVFAASGVSSFSKSKAPRWRLEEEKWVRERRSWRRGRGLGRSLAGRGARAGRRGGCVGSGRRKRRR